MAVTLLMGGTFDPVHVGHVDSARALRSLFGNVRVVLIPSKIPPHRNVPAAEPEQRFAMLRLALATETTLECDDCELKREGHSYTFDTLSEYREKIGNQPLVFVMGLDAWLTLPTWHNWKDLCELAHLLVMMRPGSETQSEPEVLREWASGKLVDEPEILATKPAGCICHVTLPQVDVSATAVRKAIREGADTLKMLHPDVTDYIARQGLYLDNENNG